MANFDTDKWSVGARSETGYVRDENQDRMSWIRAPFGDVYIVSDGMGGVGDGSLAAELTVGALQQQLGSVRYARRRVVRQAFEAANEAVYTRAHSAGAGTPGMGATAVAVLARASSIMVAHVGDSRAYLFSDGGHYQRLTKDHSRVQHMVDNGTLTAAQALTHPEANVIERAVGHAPRIEVDISAWLPLRNGDRIMVCSDGLCGYADDAEIAAVLRAHPDPQQAADKLVELALAKGGEDNVTVQVIRYQGDGAPGPALRPRDYVAVVLAATAAATLAAVVSERYLPPARLQRQVAAMQQQVAALRQRLGEHETASGQLRERSAADLNLLQARVDTVQEELRRQRDAAGNAPAQAHPAAGKQPARKRTGAGRNTAGRAGRTATGANPVVARDGAAGANSKANPTWRTTQ
jgi:serine/threonine protein phosphatase PrpC